MGQTPRKGANTMKRTAILLLAFFSCVAFTACTANISSTAPPPNISSFATGSVSPSSSPSPGVLSSATPSSATPAPTTSSSNVASSNTPSASIPSSVIPPVSSLPDSGDSDCLHTAIENKDHPTKAAPSCTANGYILLECKLCGQTWDYYVEAFGHAIDSHCTQKPTCQYCGKVFPGDVNSNDHRYIEYNTNVGYQAPTCTSKGYEGHKKVCMNCGYVFEKGKTLPTDPSNHIRPDGTVHWELRNQVPSTCEDGYSGDYYCLDCGGLVEKGKIVPAMGCVSDDAIPATCCSYSYCSRCGQVWEWLGYDYKNHTGKTEVRNAKTPTCCEGYSGDTYCLSCNKIRSYGHNLPPVRDHKWKILSQSATSIVMQCIDCGTTTIQVG